MKKLEYLVIDIAHQQDTEWLKWGADGWELITAQTLQGTVSGMAPMEISVTKFRLIFKREIA